MKFIEQLWTAGSAGLVGPGRKGTSKVSAAMTWPPGGLHRGGRKGRSYREDGGQSSESGAGMVWTSSRQVCPTKRRSSRNVRQDPPEFLLNTGKLHRLG